MAALDRVARTMLWRELNPLLLRYVRGRVGDGAEDVTGQAWLDAARRLDEFEGNDLDFRRWMFTIARHRSIDELRRRGRRAEEPAATMPFEPAEVGPGRPAGPGVVPAARDPSPAAAA